MGKLTVHRLLASNLTIAIKIRKVHGFELAIPLLEIFPADILHRPWMTWTQITHVTLFVITKVWEKLKCTSEEAGQIITVC